MTFVQRPGISPLVWRWYLAVTGITALIFHFTPISFWNVFPYFAVAFGRSIATWWAVRRMRPPDPRPWHLLAAGTFLWTLGEAYQTYAMISEFHGDGPNLSDLLFLSGYVAMGIGLFRIGRGGERRGPANGLVDALIVFVAVAVLAWAFLVNPTTLSHVADGLPATLRMMYPVLDLCMISLLVWMGAAPEVRTGAYRTMILSLTLWTAANAGYHFTSFSSGQSSVFLQDLWLFSHVFWGTAVLMPSLSGFWARRVGVRGDDTTGRLAMLLIATMSAPVTLVLQFWRHDELDVVAVSVAGALMAALSVRFRRLIRRLTDQAERLSELSRTDFLTGLPNRRALNKQLDVFLDDYPNGLGVLLIDVDRFKGYNDSFGHKVGDELLIALARRWSDCLGPGVFLARTGGDEFTALIPASAGGERALDAARGLVDSVKDPVVVSHIPLAVEVSIGVTVSRGFADTAEALLNEADVAMYTAKDHQTQIQTYCESLDRGDGDRFRLLNDLRGGIERDELAVYFQPQLDLASGRVVGVEALVRWFHPIRGEITPGSFVPAAEKTGLIRPITTFVLNSSLAACARWRAEGHEIRVGVNVSARSLFDESFVADISAALNRHDVPPSLLDLEITESSVMLDIDSAIATLVLLANLGVRLSVDDFGTGHSSLEYLHRLPMNVIKIDQSFVTGEGIELRNELIVRSTIDLANGLGMETVAEGVEDIAALDTLRDLGCDAAQGYAIARPMPADAITEAIASIEAQQRRPMPRIH